jgi:hypothetical protein
MPHYPHLYGPREFPGRGLGRTPRRKTSTFNAAFDRATAGWTEDEAIPPASDRDIELDLALFFATPEGRKVAAPDIATRRDDIKFMAEIIRMGTEKKPDR